MPYSQVNLAFRVRFLGSISLSSLFIPLHLYERGLHGLRRCKSTEIGTSIRHGNSNLKLQTRRILAQGQVFFDKLFALVFLFWSEISLDCEQSLFSLNRNSVEKNAKQVNVRA